MVFSFSLYRLQDCEVPPCSLCPAYRWEKQSDFRPVLNTGSRRWIKQLIAFNVSTVRPSHSEWTQACLVHHHTGQDPYPCRSVLKFLSDDCVLSLSPSFIVVELYGEPWSDFLVVLSFSQVINPSLKRHLLKHTLTIRHVPHRTLYSAFPAHESSQLGANSAFTVHISIGSLVHVT